MIAWPFFFEDSDLIVNKLRLLHGKGVNSGTPSIYFLCQMISVPGKRVLPRKKAWSYWAAYGTHHFLLFFITRILFTFMITLTINCKRSYLHIMITLYDKK
jgi:hypothetical protein